MMFNKLLKMVKKPYRNSEDININEVNNIIKTEAQSVLLDVRSPQEYREGHLNRCNKYTIV